ncbi:MAG: dTDP-4-dehydrorhamnose reductase [Bacteroidales bacterium]|nr:dTDP-4-dehydrorhamnose reductase [Bacteroidales bacterium]
MNVLVTGANGQLGNELRLLAKESAHRFIFSDVNKVPGVETVYLDITDTEALEIVTSAFPVDVIVNCAAYTNVDKAEDDIGFAELLNSTAAANLAALAKRRDATLIHISTDYVFSGNACKPIPENAEPQPASVYGATKLAGEKAVENSGCKSLIIRTAWLYSPFGKNFVKTMLGLVSSRKSLNVVCDQVGSPTSAADLAAFIMTVIDGGEPFPTGIYHYTDEGVASWYDFAKAIAELSGNECDVRPCTSEEYPSKVKRPHYSVLDKSLVKKTFGITVPHWRDSLKACLERISSDESRH